MSIYSQFISKFIIDANSYVLGEIVSYPSIINGPSTLDSNNFIKTGAAYTTTEHSSLSSLIGKIEAYSFKPNTSFSGYSTGLRKTESLMYVIIGNKVYSANVPNQLQEISTLPNALSSTGTSGSHRLRYNYEKELFLLAGPLANQISTSTDAVTWNVIEGANTNTTTTNPYIAFNYGNGVYIALSYYSQDIRTSSDLNYWGQFPNIRANNSSTIRSSVYAKGKYVLVGDSGVVKTSANGLLWADETSGTSSILRAVTFGNELFVYAGDGGVLASSTDAVTWTARTSNSSNNITTLAYSDGIFIYGTSNGSIGRSTNGTSWTFYPGVVTNTIYSSAAKSGLYVVGADAGKVATSTNGITWTSRANVTINLAVGQAEYTTPGTYSWTAPPGVTSVSVVCVGGGGGRFEDYTSQQFGYYNFWAGGGGGLGWKNNISVTPGSSYTVNVGRGGIGYGSPITDDSSNTMIKGLSSWFLSNTTVLGGGAGFSNTEVNLSNYGYNGGQFTGDGGSDGGDGRFTDYKIYFSTEFRLNPAAGGAGGYGPMLFYGRLGGGDGLNSYESNSIFQNQTATSFPSIPYFPVNTGGGSTGRTGAGGGVGIWGMGVDGNVAVSLEGSDPLRQAGRRLFGKGGNSRDQFSPYQSSSSSSNGAVRIVWGPNREYSNTANVYLIGNIASGSVETDDFYSMVYANGIFLGGSANGRIFTSTDAVTWSLSYASGNNIFYVANTIHAVGYINHGYVYGDSTGQLGFNSNTGNVWYATDGNFSGNTILTIATNGNDYVYAGSNGWIGKVDNGFTGLRQRNLNGSLDSYYDFLYDNTTRQFVFVGNYGKVLVSEPNTVNGFKVPFVRKLYQGFYDVGIQQLPYFDDISHSFFTIEKIYRDSTNTRIFIGGSGPSSNLGFSLISTELMANSTVLGPYIHDPVTTRFYSSNFNTYYNTYNFYNYITCINPSKDYNEFFVGTGSDAFYSSAALSTPTYYSLGTNNQGSSNRSFVNIGNNGVEIVLLDFGTHLTTNSYNSLEYSPSYNVQSQFFIPYINIAPVSLGSSVLLTSNDHFTIANTIYENTYIKAK